MKNFLTGLVVIIVSAWLIWGCAALNGQVQGVWMYVAMVPLYLIGGVVLFGFTWLLGGWLRGDL